MVNPKIKPALTIVALCMILLNSSCSYTKSFFGGAGTTPRKTVVIPEGAPLPSFVGIFSEDQQVSKTTLGIWRKNLTDTFGEIRGKKKDYLSKREIQTLVRKGFVKLSDNPEVSVKKATAVLELLGFKEGVSANDVQSLFDWLEKNHAQASIFYKTFMASDTSNASLNSKNLMLLIQFFGSFIELGGSESMSASKMNSLLQPWIPENMVHVKIALESGVELAISFFSSFCGDRVEPNLWNGKKIGVCLRDMTTHFKDTEPVFDFIFNQLNPITDREKLYQANLVLVPTMKSWMEGHHHPSFPVARISNLSTKLEIPPPYNFFKLTEWLPKLNPASTTTTFSPLFFIDLSQMIHQWVETLQTATKDMKCNLEDWRKCKFNGSYSTVDELYNDEYATMVREKNLDLVNQLSLYDSVATLLMNALDTDHDGLLVEGTKDLIMVATRLIDSNAFSFNIVARLMEKPIGNTNIEDDLKNYIKQGLGEVVALAADLIPDRGNNKRNLFNKLTAQISSKKNEFPNSIDHLGITTFMYTYNLVSTLRDDYLTHYDLPQEPGNNTTYIQRKKIVESMPRMLFDHFPRIYNECLEWGFERTCGVIFTDVLSDPDKGKDTLEPNDIDTMTITAIMLESMMNRCDRNKNDMLDSNILDGFDEKHCAITVSEALITRLMSANIVKKNSKATLLMNLINKLAIARWAGKVAITKGTFKGIVFSALPPVSLFSGKASLGSVMSLAAEVMNTDKVVAIEDNTVPKEISVGDEVIFHNNLTLHFLPSIGQATRTSEAATALSR